jgi:hypothetical protein
MKQIKSGKESYKLGGAADKILQRGGKKSERKNCETLRVNSRPSESVCRKKNEEAFENE